MFHKVKLRGLVFDFSPVLINHYYGRQNEGITGSTLKLDDIIKTLTGGALSPWPTKGKLQASALSLRYVVMHKVAIVNLVPTSNNTNLSKHVGRMMYVMGILIHQHLEVIKAEEGSGKDAKPLTITNKLMTGNHVVDVQIKGTKRGRVSELQAKIQALRATASHAVNDHVSADINESTTIPPTMNDPTDDPAKTSKF
ncbi:hypothetical protein LIER_34098 [Lithospermum erythrorhizon]|uniref:Uncharacterized protein n=1 Tax=Lithospermum erythrorhizon TaxID=34254 RepID=A0AAV3S1M8_LITER